MSFIGVRPAIHAALLTIPEVAVVIAGMPTGIHVAPPLFITQFLSGQRVGSTNAFNWRYQLHGIISHQANTLGENEIDDLVAATFATFSPKLADVGGHNRARLGGAAEQCWFEDVRSGDTDGYISFGDPAVVFRRVGFVLVVKTMEAY